MGMQLGFFSVEWLDDALLGCVGQYLIQILDAPMGFQEDLTECLNPGLQFGYLGQLPMDNLAFLLRHQG